MKIFSVIIVLFNFLNIAVTAQPGYSYSDSAAIFNLIDKADNLSEKGQFDSSLMIANKAAELAKTKKFYKGQGWALEKAVEVLIEQRQLVKAEALLMQINKIADEIDDTLLTGVSIMQKGQIKMYNGETDQAILMLDKSIRTSLGLTTNIYLALALNDLGYAWGMKEEYDKQAGFTHKALSIYEKLGDDAGLGMTLGNLSTVYYQLGQKEKAIEYGKQSLKYREKTGDIARISITCCNLSQYYLGINIDEAVKYQELCVKYARQTGEESRIIHSYISSSLVANAKKNNKEAFEYELKIIDLLEKSKSDPSMLARRYIAAAIYNDILKYDSLVTIDYYNKAIRLSQELGNRQNLKDAYLYLSNFHSRKKNFSEAYFNYKKHVLYKDSLISADKEEKIAELERQYMTSKKDNEIDRLNNEKRIKQLEIEKQKAIIAGNTATAMQRQNEIDLLSKSKELQEIKINQQEEELEKQLLLSNSNAQQLELTEKENQLRQKQLKNQRLVKNMLIAGLGLFILLGFTYFNRYQLKKKLEQQNSLLTMRNNISQDLHDDIGASLSSINILNELARRNISQPEKSKEYLSKASEDIQRISESLSDIVWNINPQYDDLQNLFVRMKRYAADMIDGKNINGQFDFPPDDKGLVLSMTKRRDLYLIFKEAVNNLTKYSQAKNAIIGVKADGQKLELMVKDDGKGFDSKTAKAGNGLRNMEHRAKAVGGELSVTSSPGTGTIVRFVMNVS